MIHCKNCGAENEVDKIYCRLCGSADLEIDLATAQAKVAEEELRVELLYKAERMLVSTLDSVPEGQVIQSLGLVFGNSSKQAFWGFSTQANRLSRAYDAALINMKYEAASIGADAVVAVKFALNNSSGSANKLLTGSSEAVMLLGTAVKFKENSASL